MSTKVHIVKAIVFPVVINGYELDHIEGSAPKNWCFWAVVLERLLRVPWTARKSNQSVLKEINLNYSLEGLLLNLKRQYFDHLRQKADSLEKTLTLGKIEGRSRRGKQRMRWLDGITKSMDMSLSKVRRWWIGKPSMLQSMGLKESDTTKWLHNDHFPIVRHLLFYPMAIIICVLLLTLFPSRYSGLPALSHFALLDTHTSLVLFSFNRMPSPNEHLPNSVLTAFKALKRVLQILRLPRTTQVYNSSGSLQFLWFQI